MQRPPPLPPAHRAISFKEMTIHKGNLLYFANLSLLQPVKLKEEFLLIKLFPRKVTLQLQDYILTRNHWPEMED